MAKGTQSKASERFDTTDGVSKKIYDGFMKGAIKFGEKKESEDAVCKKKFWKASPLANGTKISLSVEHKHGENPKGSKFNPRYKLSMEHKGNTETYSGTFIRKIYLKLENPTKGKKTTKLSEDGKKFAMDALASL